MKAPLVLLGLLAATLARADALDDYVKRQMEADHIPGVALAVVNPSGMADIRTFGLANLELNSPYKEETVHRIASVSKQFCGYTILRLVKEGKLALSDPLSKFFPKGHKDWSTITIKDMLAHRSGIPDPGTAFDYRSEYSPEAYVQVLSAKPLTEKPGATFRYNNHGFALLGLIVQQLTGKSLAENVKSSIFEPIGMSSSRYWTLEEVVPNRSEAYRWKDDKFYRPLMIRPRIFDGSGGILSTIQDMVKYDAALRAQTVLDKEILKKQWATLDGSASGYWAGWFISHPEGKLVLRHSGGTFGFTSYFLREVDAGWSVILFRNGEGGDVTAWANEILKLAKGV